MILIEVKNWTLPVGHWPVGWEGDNPFQRLEFYTDIGPEWDLKFDVKQDDAGVKNVIDLTLENGHFCVDLTRDMLPVRGQYMCQLRGLDGDRVMHTNPFVITVGEGINAIEGFTLKAPSEMTQIEQRVTVMKGAAVAAAQEARQAAELAQNAHTGIFEARDTAVQAAIQAGQDSEAVVLDRAAVETAKTAVDVAAADVAARQIVVAELTGQATEHAGAVEIHAGQVAALAARTAESCAAAGLYSDSAGFSADSAKASETAALTAKTDAEAVKAALDAAASAALSEMQDNRESASDSAEAATAQADRAKDEADRAAEIAGGDYATKQDAQGFAAAAEQSAKAASRPASWMPTAAETGSIPATQLGAAGGAASLDGTGKVPAAQLPAMNYDPAGSAEAVRAGLSAHVDDMGKHITDEDRTTMSQATRLSAETAALLGITTPNPTPDDALKLFLKAAFFKEILPFSLNEYYWSLIASPTMRWKNASVGYHDGVWITGGLYQDPYDATNRSLKMFYSYDSKNWIKGDTSGVSSISEAHSGGGSAISICHGGERFVAIIGHHPSSSQTVSIRSVWSKDGIVWKLGNQIATYPQNISGGEVAFFKGYFYVFVQSTLYRSADGVAWVLYKAPGAIGVGDNYIFPHMIAAGNFLVISTNGSVVITTTDGVNFTPVGVGNSYQALAYKNGTFAISITGGLKLTKDFRSFETITYPDIVGLGATEDYFVAIRNSNSNGVTIALSGISKDGRVWEEINIPNPAQLGGGTISGGGGVLWSQAGTGSMLYLNLNPDTVLTNVSGRSITSSTKIDAGSYIGTGYATGYVVLHFDFTVKAFILIGGKYYSSTTAFPSISIAVSGANSITLITGQNTMEPSLIRLKDNTVTLGREFNGNAISPYHYPYIAIG